MTILRVFPTRQSWGAEWASGVNLNLSELNAESAPELLNSIVTASPSLYFQPSKFHPHSHWNFSLTASYNYIFPTSGFRTSGPARWNPFAPFVNRSTQEHSDPSGNQLIIDSSKRETPREVGKEGEKLLVTGMKLSIPLASLKAIGGPAEFVLRIWDSRDLSQLGHPLDVHSLIASGSELSGDGELARLQITEDGRLIIGSTRIGLSPDINSLNNQSHKLIVESEKIQGLEKIVEISFSARVQPTQLIQPASLLGRVLTLEKLPLGWNSPKHIQPRSIWPVSSVFAVILV